MRESSRILDILFVLFLSIIAIPLFIVLIPILWLSQGSPVFYSQNRMGKNMQIFRMYKFRTMANDADKTGGSLTMKNDSRITPIGKVLRKFKIDEFPQLLNILRGEMSVIGPRPEVLNWVEQYNEFQKQVLQVRPGLTDPVQLFFRHEQDYLESAEEYQELFQLKVERQINYLKKRNLLTDLKVILDTFYTIIFGLNKSEEIEIYLRIKEKVRASN